MCGSFVARVLIVAITVKFLIWLYVAICQGSKNSCKVNCLPASWVMADIVIEIEVGPYLLTALIVQV